MSERRIVGFVVCGTAEHAAEALRAAVGAAAAGLSVRVLLIDEGAGAIELPSAARHLGTLRALGYPVVSGDEARADLPGLLANCDAVEVWR